MTSYLYITDGVITVNFLTGDYRVDEDGWELETEDERTWQTFSLWSVAGASAIRTTQVNLDKLFGNARSFMRSKLESKAVWLYWQSDGESSKRALVTDGKARLKAQGVMNPLLSGGTAYVEVAIEHLSFWENVSATNQAFSSLDFATKFSIGNAAGSLPQRISKLTMTSSAGTAIKKLWVGIRDVRKGSTGYLVTWEAEDGVNESGYDASDVADATASDGYKVQIVFTNHAELSRRFYLSFTNAGGDVNNAEDMIGKYLVIARAKISSGTDEFLVDLRHGWSGIENMEASAGTVYLSGADNANLTNWNLIPIGVVEVPPTGNRDDATISNIQNYALAFYAQRISTTGSLDIDCFYFIPAEHLLTLEGAFVGGAGGYAYAFTSPDGIQYALGNKTGGGAYGNLYDNFQEWYYPFDGGIAVFMGQYATEHVLSVGVSGSFDLYPRWATLRT